MRVGVVATGSMELIALPQALASLFVDHEFFPIADVLPATPFPGFTSNKLPFPPGNKPELQRLLEEVGARLHPGDPVDPVDMIVILDDVELDNMDQHELVVDTFRATLECYFRELVVPAGVERGPFIQRLRVAFRRKVSFHLISPMVEAWLFADPEGPERAGVPASRCPPLVTPVRDPEQFRTFDRDYETFDNNQCVGWAQLQVQRRTGRRITSSRQKSNKPAWVGTFDRTLHPKAYLAWLCRDLSAKRCSTYRETSGEVCGATSLAALDWSSALCVPSQGRFMRALIDDLAHGLGEDNPFSGDTHELTRRKPQRSPEFVLRNL